MFNCILEINQTDARAATTAFVPQSSVLESFVRDCEEDCEEMSEKVG